MVLDVNQQAFLHLLRAGLWEQDSCLLPSTNIDFNKVLYLAEEQSVVGLVAAGIERIHDIKVPQELALSFVGNALQIEQRNNAMNEFVARLIEKLRKEGVYALLLKGQGLAQCYERPLWRACGDVDLFLSETNYNAAYSCLKQKASFVEEENPFTQHLSMTIDPWEVELHGTLRSELWRNIDKMLDQVQHEIFNQGTVRSIILNSTHIFLPRYDEDVIYVFTHILQHFFKGGIGLRQVGDWCRLLWVSRDKIDHKLLRYRLFASGTETEWKAFAALAVEYLDMPADAMPFYSPSRKWKRKADRVLAFILETGNFGHNRDMSFLKSTFVLKRKSGRFWHITKDTFKQFMIFPLDALKVWLRMMGIGLSVLVRKH